ncbi:hypothetical protein ISN45_Aa03g029770 [Arabidopsis thaliana x Arabidopsis arenosa]|uniref:Uncharacterized protein n=1 Tax=Arabidopsis thaliana x Arabidopsis arenosa TaxID=1240361 RepID=A0A8T2AX62_9BRAS|nr:hypothetical protein ISN45_Aa03g029770 [Arabidopsis thaliana x Arabidopsis arenosa]
MRASTINNKGGRWCPAISILHPLHASSLPKSPLMEPPNSRSEASINLWFSFHASFLRLNHQTQPLPPPEMFAAPIISPPSLGDGRRTSSLFSPAKRKLGFQLVGLFMFGPLSFLKSNPLNGDPNCFLLKPRFVIFSLSTLSQFRCRFTESFDRGRQLERNAPLLLCSYKNSLPLASPRIVDHENLYFTKKGFMCPTPSYLRTLPLESSRITSHVLNCLKKNDIMIPHPRSGDYRSFFSPIYPLPLFSETIHVQISYFREDFHPFKSLILMSGFFYFLWQTDYKLCVEFLNLHGRQGLHVREDPPVMLRSCTYQLRILVVKASFRFLNLSNDHSPSCVYDNFKPHALHTCPTCYGLSKLNSHSVTSLANNLKHHSTFILARNLVKALPRVILLVPARISTLAHSPTPLRLFTVAYLSSVDSLLEDSSIIFDLTCTKKLHSFWLKALKKLLSINLIYLFIYFMLALGKGPLCCNLNFGISDSFYLCTWVLP